MKKLCLMLTVLMLALPTMAYANNNLLITVNGNTIGYGLVINGTTHVPVRELQNIGAEVNWDNATKTATVTYQSSSLSLSPSAGIKILNGRSYAVLRTLNALDGIQVSYDASTKTVLLKTAQDINIEPNNNGSNNSSNNNNNNSNNNVTGEFIRQPLPPISPNPTPDYRDLVRSGQVEFDLEVAVGKFLDDQYDEGSLPYIRVKADPIKFTGNLQRSVTLREVMSTFAKILRLSPNSDERNIPLNLRGYKTGNDYILWSKLAKTGMFQHLIKDDGTIDMNRAIQWSEMRKALYIYFIEYMGVDLNNVTQKWNKPFNAGQFAKCSAEDQEILILLRHIGLTFGFEPHPNFENPYEIPTGPVTVHKFSVGIKRLTLN